MAAGLYQQEMSKHLLSDSKMASAAAAAGASQAAMMHQHELVAKIYRDELHKLLAAAEKRGNADESSEYRRQLAQLASRVQHSTPFNAQAPLVKAEDDKENVTSVKAEEKEMSRMRTQSTESNEAPQDLRVKYEASDEDDDVTSRSGSAFSRVRHHSLATNDDDVTNTRHFSPTPSPPPPSAAQHPTPNFNPKTPRPPHSSTPKDSKAAPGQSPLQQMQTIANSLMTKSGMGNAHGQRPLKAVLPPISQDVFDKYASIDTDELVKRIKEILSQFSISQRLFGENVLGLSQGSVSDLLARPKPWRMLTQKGREPFIRMKVRLKLNHAGLKHFDIIHFLCSFLHFLDFSRRF